MSKTCSEYRHIHGALSQRAVQSAGRDYLVTYRIDTSRLRVGQAGSTWCDFRLERRGDVVIGLGDTQHAAFKALRLWCRQHNTTRNTNSDTETIR